LSHDQVEDVAPLAQLRFAGAIDAVGAESWRRLGNTARAWLVASPAIVVLLLLLGCDAEPRTVSYRHAAGFTVVLATRSAWELTHPDEARVERMRESSSAAARASGSGMSGWGTYRAAQRYESAFGCGRMLAGRYYPATREAWVFCADPFELTEDERWTEKHEIAHGVEHAWGWECAAPLWDELPRRHRTHASIEDRLDGWRQEQQQ
jgi:hypothetical protein